MFDDMTQDVIKMWVKALRSGKYIQGRGRLKMEVPEKEGKPAHFEHCCLGVLCEELKIANKLDTSDVSSSGKLLSRAYEFDTIGFDWTFQAGEVDNLDEYRSTTELPEPLREVLGMDDEDMHTLVAFNDGTAEEMYNPLGRHHTFDQIADYIETGWINS